MPNRPHHLHDFIDAYNYGRRLKILRGLFPHEYICKCWTTEPGRFNLNPQHQMLGPNTQIKRNSYILYLFSTLQAADLLLNLTPENFPLDFPSERSIAALAATH